MMNAEAYHRKQVVFIPGLNIDISPHEDQVFPLTTFVPWAAFVQDINDHCSVLEQRDIMDRLLGQSEDNPDEVDLEVAIQKMQDAEEIKIKLLD